MGLITNSSTRGQKQNAGQYIGSIKKNKKNYSLGVDKRYFVCYNIINEKKIGSPFPNFSSIQSNYLGV